MINSDQELISDSDSEIDFQNTNTEYKLDSSLELPIFDIKKLFNKRETSSIFIVGSRRSGKTTLISHLWKGLKDSYDIMFIFCNASLSDLESIVAFIFMNSPYY